MKPPCLDLISFLYNPHLGLYGRTFPYFVKTGSASLDRVSVQQLHEFDPRRGDYQKEAREFLGPRSKQTILDTSSTHTSIYVLRSFRSCDSYT
jgi:hypothetical protein